MAGIYRHRRAATICVDGRMSTFIELGVGFNPDLAARDNVILNAIMLGLTPREARGALRARSSSSPSCSEFEDLKLKNYSSGMHVRLAFSVMIQVDADILLIDEVLAVGDAAFQQKCFDEFNRLRDEGRTILLVTHDMGAVARFCDRAMLLERGEVVAIGDPERRRRRSTSSSTSAASGAAADASPTTPRPHAATAAREIADAWFEDERRRAGRRRCAQGATCAFTAVRASSTRASRTRAFGVAVENDEHQRRVRRHDAIWSDERTGRFAAGERGDASRRVRQRASRPGATTSSPSVARRGGGPTSSTAATRIGVVRRHRRRAPAAASSTSPHELRDRARRRSRAGAARAVA